MIELKESVFVPCGHRCCCYKDACDIFNKFKKCPICNKNIEFVLKKVYD